MSPIGPGDLGVHSSTLAKVCKRATVRIYLHLTGRVCTIKGAMSEVSEEERGRFWVGARPNGRLSVRDSMHVFFAWISSGRDTEATAEETGVTQATVIRLVKKGMPVRGIPPFNEMAGWAEMNGIIASFARDASMGKYRYSPKEAVAQMLQICDGIRKQLKDAIVGGSVKIKTMRDALDLVKALTYLEKNYTELGRQFGLIGDNTVPEQEIEQELQTQIENPPGKERAEEIGPELNFKKMSLEELKNWTEAHKGAEASG